VVDEVKLCEHHGDDDGVVYDLNGLSHDGVDEDDDAQLVLVNELKELTLMAQFTH